VRLAKPHPRFHRTDVQIGDIAAHWLEGNEPARDRIILYLHGGAFMLRYPTPMPEWLRRGARRCARAR
jgi:acetyl esterase/lipase